MSYGVEHKIDGRGYLIEIFDSHIHIARIKSKEYITLYEGDYECAFDKEELKQLKKLDYDKKLYVILHTWLDSLGETDSYNSYRKYIIGMLNDGMTKKDILSNSSDEAIIYDGYFPLDVNRKMFERVTRSIIDKTFQCNGCDRVLPESEMSDVMEMYICNRCEEE